MLISRALLLSGPHCQEDTVPPGVTAPVLLALAQGLRSMFIVSAAVFTPWIVTWITPLALVLICLTYLEEPMPPAIAELVSQPHKPGPGKVEADCAVSVILVRQAEAARMASEILARAV